MNVTTSGGKRSKNVRSEEHTSELQRVEQQQLVLEEVAQQQQRRHVLGALASARRHVHTFLA